MQALQLLRLLVIGTVLLAPLSIAMLWLGIRGRRIDDHPWCRRCRYDLLGVDRGGSCPECGVSLGRRRVVVVGHRRRRRGLLLAGVAATALTLTGGGFIAWESARGIDWQPIKPAWWLRLEARHGTAVTADCALVELNARLARGSLSRGQVRAIVAAGVARQAQPGVRWLRKWGTFIEAARGDGLVEAEAWQAYVEQAVEVAVEARDRIVAGDPLLRRLIVTDRAAPNSVLSVSGVVRGCTLDGAEIPTERSRISRGLGTSPRAAVDLTPGSIFSRYPYQLTGDYEAAVVDVAPGQHVLACHSLLEVYELRPGAARRDDAVVTIDRVARQTITVEPAGTETVRWSDAEDQATLDAIRLRRVRAWSQSGGDGLLLDFAVVNPPIDLAFEVYLEAGGERWLMGRLAVDADEVRPEGYSVRRRFQRLPARRGDVVMEPSHDVAVTAFGIDSAYGRAVRIEGVVVEWASTGGYFKP